MKHLSIDGFAGGGGASCGLKMAGIDVIMAAAIAKANLESE